MAPRSHIVETEDGRFLRRNRQHLLRTHERCHAIEDGVNSTTKNSLQNERQEPLVFAQLQQGSVVIHKPARMTSPKVKLRQQSTEGRPVNARSPNGWNTMRTFVKSP
ncbi:hypothetical protein MTO96_036851 [Rhipicephalus appendiculatus]